MCGFLCEVVLVCEFLVKVGELCGDVVVDDVIGDLYV